MQTRALLFTAPGKVELRDIQIPEPESHEVLIEVACSCVSPGTEGRVLAGLQDGAPDFPLIPGYSCAGRVVSRGSKVRLPLGAAVFSSGTAKANHARAWGGHVGHAVVPESAVIPIPDGVELRDAAAAKLAAIACHGVRLASPVVGEKVAVLGLGPIGFFSALIFQAIGATVAVNDLSSVRVATAREAGLRVGDFEQEGGADIVVDATGAGPALATAARLARKLPWDEKDYPSARLLIQGSYAVPPPFPYDEIFSRELQVLVPRDNRRCDLEEVLGLMASGRLSCRPIVGEFGPPSRAAEVYSQLGNLEPVTGVFCWAES